MYPSKENPLCSKQEHRARFYPVRFLKAVLPENHCFQVRERLILFQIGLLSRIEEKYLLLQRQQSLLQALASRTLFPRSN
jgi:hypothetical protein